MANELGLLIQAELDRAKTSAKINQQLDGIKVNDIKINVDTSQTEKKLNAMRKLILDAENLRIRTPQTVNLDWSKYIKSLETNDIKQARVELDILNKTYRNLSDTMAKALPNQALENLPKRVTDADTKVKLLINSFKNLQTQGAAIPDTTFTKLDALSKELSSLSGTTMDEGSISRFKQLSIELNNFTNEYKLAASTVKANKIAIADEKVTVDIRRARQELLNMRTEWSAFTKNTDLNNQWKKLFDASLIAKSRSEVTLLNSNISLLKKNITGLGLDRKSLFGQLTENVKKFSQWFFIGGSVASIVRTVRDVYTNVVELNKAFVDLQMATNGTAKETKALVASYAQLGKEMGATTGEVSASASDWLRQGKSIADTNTLIRDSLILSKIGNLDAAAATEYLTSATKGYKIAVEDTIGVVDKLSAVDLVSATSAGGLATGLSEVANNANLAGISMDKLLGYLAAIGETTQDPLSEVGHSLSTMFSRMSNIKLSKLSSFQNSGESLNNVETVLNVLGVKLRDEINGFRSFSDVLDEVAGKWGTYTEVEQRALATAFASKTNMEDFLVLMENYSTAAKYTSVSMDSAGTALEKYSKYQDSIEAKQKAATAAFEQFSMAILSSDLIKGSFDAGTGILSFLTQIIEQLGAIPALAGVAAAALSFKNVGSEYAHQHTIALMCVG